MAFRAALPALKSTVACPLRPQTFIPRLSNRESYNSASYALAGSFSLKTERKKVCSSCCVLLKPNVRTYRVERKVSSWPSHLRFDRDLIETEKLILTKIEF